MRSDPSPCRIPVQDAALGRNSESAMPVSVEPDELPVLGSRARDSDPRPAVPVEVHQVGLLETALAIVIPTAAPWVMCFQVCPL
jgi:hypothetical protein